MKNAVNCGFTLIEMVTVLTMVAVTAAISGPHLAQLLKSFDVASTSTKTLASLQIAISRIEREIREIRPLPDTPGQYDISRMASDELVFTKTDGEQVRIKAAPPSLFLSYASIDATPELNDKLAYFKFQYLQEDGISSADGDADVAFIGFQLILESEGRQYPQRSLVALRNLL